MNPDGYIATAGHCVDPTFVEDNFLQDAAQWAVDNGYFAASYLTVKDVLNFGIFQVRNADGKRRPDTKAEVAWGVSAGGVETGKALPARVLKWQKFDQGDGAMLKVEATDLNALPISDQSVDVGTSLVAVGYPAIVDVLADQSFSPSYKEGSISSKKTVSGGLLSVYEISAATTQGMSGGPAVDTNGNVIGFVSYGDPERSNFNFIRPTQQIKELLGDAGATNTLSQDTKDYRAGLDALFAGNRTTAVAKLSSVVDNQPTNEFAKKYLDQAKRLPLPEKTSNTGLIVGIVVGLLVLALLAGLVIWLLTRGRRKGTAGGTPGAAPYAAPPVSGPPPGYPPPAGPAPAASTTTSTAVLDPSSGPSPATPAPEAAPDAEPVFCPNCGTRADHGQKFCKHCGTTLA